MTDELIRKSDALAAVHLGDTVTKLQARIATLPAVTVGVKPLLWEWNGAMWRTYCIAGRYCIFKTENPRNDRYMVTYVFLGSSGNTKSHTVGYFDGIEAAKSAAQQDYETRILAALEPVTQPDPAAIREAALREAHDAIADYPRVAPDGAEAQHYDEQIEYCQSIILALIQKGTTDDRA